VCFCEQDTTWKERDIWTACEELNLSISIGKVKAAKKNEMWKRN
jgi:hypothetical protein